MAATAVERRGVSVAVACRTFGVSETCYRYSPLLSDENAQIADLLVGLDNYVEAGGDILRDLFQQDDGGWLQDASLLDVMVTEKLADEAEVIRAEGWKWVEVDTDFPYGHTFGMRRIHGEAEPMSDLEAADYQALKAEYDALEAEHAEADELPEEVDARLGEIETAMPGADTAGYAGLEDRVDHHWASVLRAAGLSTLLAVGAELAIDDEDRLARALRDGALDTINEAGQRIVSRQLEVPPRLTIRAGFPVRVIVTRDIVLAPAGD